MVAAVGVGLEGGMCLLVQVLPEALPLMILFWYATPAMVWGSFKYSDAAVGTPSVSRTIVLVRVSTPLFNGLARSRMCPVWSSKSAPANASAIPVPPFAWTAATWCGMSLPVPSWKVVFGPQTLGVAVQVAVQVPNEQMAD